MPRIFLGLVVEYNSILESSTETKAIIDMPKPKSVDDVRRFLGMVTYYCRFIPNASTRTAPIRNILKKDTMFKCIAQCKAAFLRVKREITSDRDLMLYDSSSPVQLACDASSVIIAGIFSHIADGEKRRISFASRFLKQAEQNYSQLDREVLAIVFSIEHFY